MMNAPDLVRLVTALLATMALLFFCVRINDDWSGLSRGWRITRLSMAGLIFVGALGSAELMLASVSVPLGARNALLPTFLISLLVGLYRVRTEPAPTSRADPACTFPGCILARKDFRALAVKYPSGIPPHLVLAIVDGVEAHEHTTKTE